MYEVVDLPIAYMIKIVGSKLDVVDKNFSTRQDAEKFLAENVDKLESMPHRHIPQKD